jgi:hypothetical protein
MPEHLMDDLPGLKCKAFYGDMRCRISLQMVAINIGSCRSHQLMAYLDVLFYKGFSMGILMIFLCPQQKDDVFGIYPDPGLVDVWRKNLHKPASLP